MDIREYRDYNEDDIIRLYSAVGWTAYTEHPTALRRGFENSLLVLAAYEKDTLLGLIRIVGDGSTVIFVQDLLVFPAYQRRGVGSALLQAILKRYRHARQIQLTSDNTPEARAFYTAMGFHELSEIGCCGFMKG